MTGLTAHPKHREPQCKVLQTHRKKLFYFWIKVSWPINIQIVMKLRTKTELSRSIGMDLFPILNLVKQDPSLKQYAQSSVCVLSLSESPAEKKQDFFNAVSCYLFGDLFVIVNVNVNEFDVQAIADHR